MAKLPIFLLLPVALAGCAVGHIQLPMMTLGPSDSSTVACLGYDGAPVHDDCKAAVSSPEQAK
jgi:hypothetical protein